MGSRLYTVYLYVLIFEPCDCIIYWKQKPAIYHSLKSFAAIVFLFLTPSIQTCNNKNILFSVSLFWKELLWPHFPCESFDSKEPGPRHYQVLSHWHYLQQYSHWPVIPHLSPNPTPPHALTSRLCCSQTLFLRTHSPPSYSWFLQRCFYQCPGLPCSPVLQHTKSTSWLHPNWLEI